MNFLLRVPLAFTLLAQTAFAADLPGSQDPAEIKRYENSEIVRYEKLSFDRYLVPLGKMSKFDFGTKVAEFEKSEELEGAVTRVSYRLSAPERSSLEIFRNYEEELKRSGWEIAWSASGKPQYGTAFTHIYESLKDNDQLFTYNDAQGHVLVAKKPALGLTAVLFVTKFEMGLTRGIKVSKGDPLIQLDLIQTKQMEEKMVLVSSSEMAKSISDTGRVALYGIFFDFNSAELKTESEPTLQQIGNLLKEKPTLKLLVVGHTDNVGGFDFNRELSDRRSASVVKVLSGKFGIDSTRLRSFGASFASPVSTNESEEGRAKNRRVELVEMK